MKKNLLLFAVIYVHFCFGQYCGNAGSLICDTTNLLTAPGISDYTTFPCVHDSVPYNAVLQVYFPAVISVAGVTDTIEAVYIDSIGNLPCGLCWSCNDSTREYAGGGRACIGISGTCFDVKGAYQVDITGTVFTPYGVYTGSLETLGYQFFLNVVGPNDTCSPINIQVLNVSCDTAAVNPCQGNVVITSSVAPNGCQFDTTTITVVQPTGPQYVYTWFLFGATFFQQDSGQSVFLNVDSAGSLWVQVTDTIHNCSYNNSWNAAPTVGPYTFPFICYSTYDSSLANSSSLNIFFEKNDQFHTMAKYILYRQDSITQQYPRLIGQVSDTGYGLLTDTAPLPYLHSHIPVSFPNLSPPSAADNQYMLYPISICGDTFFSANYTPPLLNVDTVSWGLPQLTWSNSNPLFYRTFYVFSRYPGGSWQLRLSSNDLNDTTWIDQQPDSTVMNYMMGFDLNYVCDPTRAAINTAFSNFGSTIVSPSHVVHDTVIATGNAGLSDIRSLLVYPNPASDKLNIQMAGVASFGELNYKIYDMLGQVVATVQLPAQPRNEINISSLAGGVYTLCIKSSNGMTAVQKFIKTNY